MTPEQEKILHDIDHDYRVKTAQNMNDYFERGQKAGLDGGDIHYELVNTMFGIIVKMLASTAVPSQEVADCLKESMDNVRKDISSKVEDAICAAAKDIEARRTTGGNDNEKKPTYIRAPEVGQA